MSGTWRQKGARHRFLSKKFWQKNGQAAFLLSFAGGHAGVMRTAALDIVPL
mgnify:CR=1 FL=1